MNERNSSACLEKLANTHMVICLFKSLFSLTSAPEAEYQELPSHTYRQHFTALNLSYTKTLHATFLAHNHSPLALPACKR